MNYRGLFSLVVASLVACGGEAERDQQAEPGEADAGAFVCGSTSCGSSQICVYPRLCIVDSLPDGGSCPAGTSYSIAAAACLPVTPSCVSPGAAEQGIYDCSGAEGASCSAVTLPIPAGCSRICSVDCM